VNNPQSKASVGGKELTAMMSVLVAAHSFLNYPRFASEVGFEAAWMVPLLSSVISIAVLLVVDALFRRTSARRGLIEICRIWIGRTGTAVIAVLLALYFLIITATIMRQFTENVITTVLPNTPIYIVGGLFVASIVYVAHCGLEGIARVGYIALPVLVIGILALCLLTMKFWNTDMLFPFWGNGIVNIARGSLLGSSIFANVLLLSLIRSHIHDPRDFRRVGIKSTLYSTVVLVLFLVVYHMIFTPDEAVKMTSPMYSMARTIHLGRFVQRLESIFIFMWVSAAVVKMAITLWASAYCLSFAFDWPSYRPILPALGMLCFAGSLLPNDVALVLHLDDRFVWRFGWIATFVLPVAVIGFGTMRKAKREAV
jgi:spore germination protein (amino acid permease)